MPVIALLSDFGLRDSYVSEMKGVILSINPNATIVDITHEVDKYNVRMGAFVLASASKSFPKGTIYVAVVDPGVGGKRKGLLVEAGGDFFVGPDNGVLMLAAKSKGITKVYELTNEEYFRREVSSTFHGRDIFAPVAAHLSLGVRPESFGEPTLSYEEPSFVKARTLGDKLVCEVVHVDSFGNVVTNALPGQARELGFSLGEPLTITLSGRIHRAVFSRTYSDVPKGELAVLIGSHGFIEVAENLGNAAKRLRAEPGSEVEVRPRAYPLRSTP